MIPVAWLAAFGGFYLVWAAINNRNPISALRAALTGDTNVAPLTSGTSAAGAGGGAGGTTSTAVSSTPGTAPVTVPIGYGSHRLTAPAAAAYKAAGIKYGRTIPITDSTRTYEQQADCYRRKPNLCAPPSWNAPHVRGVAIDVDSSKVDLNDPRLVSALSSTGWVRNGKKVDGQVEPWHWEYKG